MGKNPWKVNSSQGPELNIHMCVVFWERNYANVIHEAMVAVEIPARRSESSRLPIRLFPEETKTNWPGSKRVQE